VIQKLAPSAEADALHAKAAKLLAAQKKERQGDAELAAQHCT